MTLKINLSKRAVVRIISFAAAAALIAAGFIFQKTREADAYRTRIAYGYSRSLEELSSQLSNIRLTLEKGLYAGTPSRLATLAAELVRESASAKSALASLPVGDGELTSVNRFLSQVGDFALYLSKKRISGAAADEEEYQSHYHQ